VNDHQPVVRPPRCVCNARQKYVVLASDSRPVAALAEPLTTCGGSLVVRMHVVARRSCALHVSVAGVVTLGVLAAPQRSALGAGARRRAATDDAHSESCRRARRVVGRIPVESVTRRGLLERLADAQATPSHRPSTMLPIARCQVRAPICERRGGWLESRTRSCLTAYGTRLTPECHERR
jgi:hypothetical protein